MIVAAGAALVLALVAALPGPAFLLAILAVCAGAIRGALTLVQASAVAERWGTGRLGLLNGIFTAPLTAATALAPAIGIGLAVVAGSYPAALVILAGAWAPGTIAVALSRPHPVQRRPSASRNGPVLCVCARLPTTRDSFIAFRF